MESLCEPCAIEGREEPATFRYHFATCEASLDACEKHRTHFGWFAGRIEDLKEK